MQALFTPVSAFLGAVAADTFSAPSNGYGAPGQRPNGGNGIGNSYSAPAANGANGGGINGYGNAPANGFNGAANGFNGAVNGFNGAANGFNGANNGYSNGASNGFNGAPNGFGNGPSSGYGAPGADAEIAALGENIPGGGVPGEDYPILSEVPETGFQCGDQAVSGYYADTAGEAGCQVFHICQLRESGSVQQDSFLCPNGTIFNQQYFVCDWWFNFDCSTAESFYSLNEQIGVTEEQGYGAQSQSVNGAYSAPLTNGYAGRNGNGGNSNNGGYARF